MKNLILPFFLILLISLSGCTVNVNINSDGDTNATQYNTSADSGNIDDSSYANEIANGSENYEPEEETPVEETEEEPETFAYSDVQCSSLTSAEMQITQLEDDTQSNAKEIELCSVNHDIMNSVNYKYYTFTLSSPARIYAMIDGMETGAFQIGIIGQDWEDGTNGEEVTYEADLEAGTYIIYVRLTNTLGTTTTGENSCFEINGNQNCWWIKGEPSSGIIKLGYRLTLSTSEIEPSSEIEEGTSTQIEVSSSCQAFSSRTVGILAHDTESSAYSVSLCDSVQDTFIGTQYQYYKITLSEETNVKFTLTKPEGSWQIGVNNYGWESSSTLGEESIVYEYTLPAGEHTVWVMVTNTAGISGADWSCREIVTDGTCYWISGTPETGTYYLEYSVSFDTQ